MKVVAFLLISLVVLGYAADTKTMLAAMTPTSTNPGCIKFAPYVNNLSPNSGPLPDATLINTLMDTLINQTLFRCIIIDDLSGIYTTIVQAANARGIKVFGTVFISADFKANGDIAEAARLANTYPNTIIGISCGSEVAYRNKDLSGTATVVQSCIQQLKTGGVQQPIGYTDTFSSWCSLNEWPCNSGYYAVYNNVDFVGLTEFPWWENINSNVFTCVRAENAVTQTFLRYNTLLNFFGNSKPIVLAAYGWPSSSGPNIFSLPNAYTKESCGIANPTNQRLVVQGTINMCAEKGVACALYDGFSQPWLAAGQAESFNNFWGVCSGTPPYSCGNAPGAAGTPLPTVGATTSTTVAVTALPTTTRAGDAGVAAVFPTGAVVGGIVGGVAAILLVAIIVVVLIVCIRVKRKKDTEDVNEQKRRLIMLELENQQPNYTKVVMLVRECGTQLKNPTGVFLAATNRDSIDPMTAGGFMCLLDLLTMYMLLDKVNTKLDARSRDRILKTIDMVNKLESPGSTKPDTKFHSDCALGFMNLLLELDQNRVNLQHVIETSKSNVIIPQSMKSIEQGWIFKLLLVRLISQEAKRSLEQLQRLIHGNVMSTREWHVIYDHVLVLCDVSMNMPKIAIMAMTDMKIIGDITNVEDTQAIGKIFNALASCNCLNPEQNKSVRLLALQGMQDIIQSPRCHLLVKKEAVMTLVLRRLLENEDEIIPVVASVSENSDLDAWKSQIEDNWNVVISLVDDKFEEQLIAKQKVNEMKQELDAWEFDIQQGNAMLTTLQNVGDDDVKGKRQKVALEDKVTRSQSEKERLETELVNAEARYDELTSEFKALKRNFETMQQNYKVPQLQVHKLTGRTNTDSNLRSLNERRNSLDAMSSERLWTAVEETYYDDVPMSLKCPLTKATFTDPVIVVSNGTTYERSAIEAWFATHDDDPLTHEVVANKTLVTNNAMKKMVNEFNLAHYEQVNIV